MVTPQPIGNPQLDRSTPHEGAFLQRPAVKATLRALNLFGGTIVAFLAFVVVGLYGALLYCEGDETRGLCAGNAELVPVLEWPIFAIAVLAPFAGGIAGFVRRQPRWLVLGAGLAVLMFGLMALVSTGQTAFEWS